MGPALPVSLTRRFFAGVRMLANDHRSDIQNTFRPGQTGGVAMTDKGLLYGDGSILARMTRGAGGRAKLALDADGDRLVALLSVAHGRPVPRADVLRHVEAASAHWEGGDKALANLRLVFAGLPKPADRAAVDRLSLAEEVLDGGMPPDVLMKALWPDTAADELRKYNPDQSRVPAGNGRRSGEWDFGGGGDASSSDSGRDGRIVLAGDEKLPIPLPGGKCLR